MKLKSEFSLKKIADKSVIIDNSAVEYDMTRLLILNDSSEWLWNRFIVGEFTQSDIEHALLEEYQIDDSTAQLAAKNWIALLDKHQLVEF